ncbi:MAG: hypothetical protein U0K70_05950 [Acutalibacteraceae bacterium]|nr:hypothetical protein [Acutalibacteraceae bacterium]
MGCESMYDERNLRETARENSRENANDCCRRNSCLSVVLFVLTSIFFYVVGTICGAFASRFVIYSIVPIAIFAIVLLLAIAIIVYLIHCRCRRS